MRSQLEVARVLELAERGLNKSQIARATGISRTTIRMWLSGRTPGSQPGVRRVQCPRCGPFSEIVPGITAYAYAYLLGLYLGDGLVSRGPRGVYRLRIFLDCAHPLIARECAAAMSVVMPSSKAGTYRSRDSNMFVVGSWSRHWPCLLPQHGPGMKHLREIILEHWQRAIVERHPHRLLRGLIHSDGCRTVNQIRHPEKTYRYPRYFFTNKSDDIRRIFCDACDRLGIEWRQNKADEVNVARRDSVARMDRLVGPKR